MAGETIVNKSALARAIGRSPARVSQLISEGKLAPPALLPDGRIDLAAAIEQLRPFLGDAPAPHQVAAAAPAPAPLNPMASAKLRQVEAAAARAEMDLAIARRSQERQLTAGVISFAKDVAQIIVALLDDRRDRLASAVQGAAGLSCARTVVRDSDLQLRRDFASAVEKEGFKLGLWASSEEYAAALREAERELSG